MNNPPVQPPWDSSIPAFVPATTSLTLAEYVRQLDEARKQACQRGARLQVMWEWMQAHNLPAWSLFCRDHPEAHDWFDEHGVPK